MTVCARCGAENQPDAAVCQSCGAALTQPEVNSALAALTTSDGRVYPIFENSKIGSGNPCDVKLSGAGVEGLHAEITYNGMDWIIYRRSNGELMLNDQPVGSFGFLRNGDTLLVGEVPLTFVLAGSAGPNLPRVIDATSTTPVEPAEPIPTPVKPQTKWVPASQINEVSRPPVQSQAAQPAEEDVYNVENTNVERKTPMFTAAPAETYNTPKPYPQVAVGKRNRIIAAILAIFLGDFGAHRFYLGQTQWGVLYLVFFWTWIPGIIGIIEGVLYLTMTDEAFALKYG